METRIRLTLLGKSGLVVSVILSSLYYFARIPLGNSSGGFKRVLLQNVILKSKSLQRKESDHYYLAGTTSHQLFLGTEKQPLQVVKISEDLGEPERIPIRVDGSLKRAYIQVDSPFFYVADKNGSYVGRGQVSDWNAKQVYFDAPPFVQLVCIDSKNFVIHTTIGKEVQSAENVLAKIRMDTLHVQINRGLLQKQKEGIYSTDGLLRYNNCLKKIIYVYFYRNEYVVIDTHLKKITRANTIDTVHTAELNSVMLGANSFSMTTPPVVVNQNARCYRQFLLVHSQRR